jgi:hypothetical protein
MVMITHPTRVGYKLHCKGNALPVLIWRMFGGSPPTAVIAWNNEAELAEAQERRQRITSDFGAPGSQGETLNELPENCRKPDADELSDHALLTGMSENPDREEVAAG